MKLYKSLNYDDIAYSDHPLFKLEIVGLGYDYGKDLDEIVRRVNAHEALLQGCEIALTLIEGTMTHQTTENVASYLRAAIGKAKGE